MQNLEQTSPERIRVELQASYGCLALELAVSLAKASNFRLAQEQAVTLPNIPKGLGGGLE